MASILSLVTDSIRFFDTYSQVYNNDEFVSLVKNTKGDLKERIQTFILNLYFRILDPYAKEVLENKEFLDIFEQQELSKDDKIKMFIAKSLKYYYQKYEQYILSFAQIDQRSFMKLGLEQYRNYVNPQFVEEPKDIYHQFVLNLSTEVFQVLQLYLSFIPGFEKITNHELNSDDYSQFIKTALEFFGEINKTFEYESPYFHDSDDSDFKSNSDSSSESSGDKDVPPQPDLSDKKDNNGDDPKNMKPNEDDEPPKIDKDKPNDDNDKPKNKKRSFNEDSDNSSKRIKK